MKTNPNDPIDHGGIFRFDEGSHGLTKREYFAAKAMSGMCANGFFQCNSESADRKTVEMAFTAVQIADLLIEFLNKPRGE